MRLDEASSSAGLQGADSGWTVAGDTTTWRMGLGNRATVRAGTAQADTIGANQVEYRQFIRPEAKLLDKARERISSNASLTPQQRETALVQLDASACAAVKCSEGVAVDAPNYQKLRDLQTAGEALQANHGLTIADTLDALGLETTFSERHGRSKVSGERFGYTFGDSANDLISRQELALGRTGQGLTMLGGAAEVAGATAVVVVTCSNPLTCGPGVVGGSLLAADGLATAGQAEAELNAPFQYRSDTGVLDSFSATTHQGNHLPWLDAAFDLGLSAAPAVIGNVARKSARELGTLNGASGRWNNSTEKVSDTSTRTQDELPGSNFAETRIVSTSETVVQGKLAYSKVVEGAENVAPDKTISASSPSEIAWGFGDLSKRQQGLLDHLPGNLSSTTVHKRGISLTDLASLTAKTGDEFALFTNGGQRLVVRGNASGVPLTRSDLESLSNQGYKWSGHSHPGTSDLVLDASGIPGDRLVLEIFGQEQSVIVNSAGKLNLFNMNDNIRIE